MLAPLDADPARQLVHHLATIATAAL